MSITRKVSLDAFFFFIYTATAEIYTLSLHDALPIFRVALGATRRSVMALVIRDAVTIACLGCVIGLGARSEEHTSELQSQSNLVCRLLLEKKNIPKSTTNNPAHSSQISFTLS